MVMIFFVLTWLIINEFAHFVTCLEEKDQGTYEISWAGTWSNCDWAEKNCQDAECSLTNFT